MRLEFRLQQTSCGKRDWKKAECKAKPNGVSNGLRVRALEHALGVSACNRALVARPAVEPAAVTARLARAWTGGRGTWATQTGDAVPRRSSPRLQVPGGST